MGSELQSKADAELEALVEQDQMGEVERLCTAHTSVAVLALVEIAGNCRRLPTIGEDGMFEIAEDEKGEPMWLDYKPSPRVSASKALLDHGHGRPTQRVVHEGDEAGGVTVILNQLTTGEKTVLTIPGKQIEDAEGEVLEVGSHASQ
jgi:hypothetical protein